MAVISAAQRPLPGVVVSLAVRESVAKSAVAAGSSAVDPRVAKLACSTRKRTPPRKCVEFECDFDAIFFDHDPGVSCSCGLEIFPKR